MAPEIGKIRVFFNHPGFIEATSDQVRDALGDRGGALVVREAPAVPRGLLPERFEAHEPVTPRGLAPVIGKPPFGDGLASIGSLPGARTPIRGFGASDCRCPTHLFAWAATGGPTVADGLAGVLSYDLWLATTG